MRATRLSPAGAARHRLQRLFPYAEAIACDFAKDSAADWRERLAGVDAVVNAAGIFRGHGANSLEQVHAAGPAALFEACAALSVPKLIQISALGAGEGAYTPFHVTKAAADERCLKLAQEHGLPGWTVIRPSLVIGQGGASTALFAALAALPWPPRLGDGTWRVQPIHVADLAHAVRLLLERGGSLPRILDLVGPAPMTTDELTQALRRWLGLAPVRVFPLPEWALRASIPFARLLSFDALSKESLAMLKHGNTAPAGPIAEVPNWMPRELGAALASEPATEAALWHARLFFLRPALRIGLAILWIWTAIVSAFVYPLEKSVEMVAGLGVSGWQASALVYAGAAVDGILGLALLFNVRPALTGLLQLAAVAVFTLLACFAVPEAWIDPLGPLTKNIAVVLATLVMIAMEAKR